nr:hypothetical protein [Desulfovibrio inopinatus]
MKRLSYALALLTLVLLPAVAHCAEPLVSIIFSGNNYGEIAPCPS